MTRRYTISEVRKIAAEADAWMGGSETTDKFNAYIDAGFFEKTKRSRKIPAALTAINYKGKEQKFQPFLLINAKFSDIKDFPCVMMPKHDGIRCLVHPTLGVVTRDLKPIPNLYIQEKLKDFVGFDGELTVGNDDLEMIVSKVMSFGGKPDFTFTVFDMFDAVNKSFIDRIKTASNMIRFNKHVRITSYVIANNVNEVMAYEEELVSKGQEGIVVKSLNSPYKFGRSTLREGFAYKIKRFEDAEATIICVNENTVHFGIAGSLTVEWKGIRFNLGNGFNREKAKWLWDNRYSLEGKKVTFKFSGYTMDGVPKFTSYVGIRNAGI